MRKFLLLLLILPCLICHAQTKQIQQLHFNSLTVKDGLPEGSADALLQDKEGYIWMGTQNGLVRYDGYKPKNYLLGADISHRKTITCLYEDKNGMLWAGTLFQGLFYYDRANDKFIQVIRTVKSDSSAILGIYNMQEDNFGSLWIGADLFKKLTDFRNINTESFIHFILNTKTKKYRSFNITKNPKFLSQYSENKNGNIWFDSFNGIYNYSYSKNKFTGYYTSSDSSKNRYFTNITQDPVQPDFMWMSYGNFSPHVSIGLCRFNKVDKSITIYKHDAKDTNSISGSSVYQIQADASRNLWLATDNGLSVYNAGKNNFTNYIINDEYKNAGGDVIYDFKQDKNGNFWCNSGFGLLFFNTKTKSFTRYTDNEKQEDGLAGNNIDNTLIDDNGILWLSANQLGLQWINKSRSRYTVYKNNPGQLHNFPGGAVNAFAEAPDGSFWLAADHGLFHWQPQTDSFTAIKLDKTQNNDVSISSVAIDKDGWVWCGIPENKSTIKGLYGYNPANGTIKNYRNKAADTTSLPDNNISHLLQDHTGLLWIGTASNGVCYFNKQLQQFTNFGFEYNDENKRRSSNKLDDGVVQSLYEDREGNIWIGTNAGAVNKYNRQTKSFISYQNHDSALGCPLSIYEDSNGWLWAGTFMGDLVQFNQNLQNFKPLLENYIGIYGIQQDKNNLWIYSSHGISLLNLSTKSMRNLQEIDVSVNNCPIFKTDSSLFLISETNGFISLNPDDFVPDTTVPVMHIEAVSFKLPQINDFTEKDSSIFRYGKDKINLKYNENRVTFSYVGLLYQNTASIQYAYKLVGYDKIWVQAGTQRMTTYTNLSPGTYTFHVKAANGDGVWATKEDAITVIISPPWWRTWWAYLIYAVVFLAALRAYVVYRSRTLRRQNKLLEEKVERRTHQLSEANEELKASQDNIAAQRDELATTVDVLKSTQAQLIQSEKMASLGELTAGIAHEIQNPLNFVNNFSEVNQEMIDELLSERAKVRSERNEELENEILNDIKANEEKINHHGKRADSIVKGMLQHSRQTKGIKEPTDINALCDEFLRLSYHGLRAKDKNFNADFTTDFDETIGKINIVPQDMGRVLLNLFNNAFYSTNEKQKTAAENYKPLVTVATKSPSPLEKGWVEVIVTDNGSGIPQHIIDKIFQPFFTTKPTGEGTGLGLSLSYDIITKEHGGTIKVESEENSFTKFIITIPS